MKKLIFITFLLSSVIVEAKIDNLEEELAQCAFEQSQALEAVQKSIYGTTEASAENNNLADLTLKEIAPAKDAEVLASDFR